MANSIIFSVSSVEQKIPRLHEDLRAHRDQIHSLVSTWGWMPYLNASAADFFAMRGVDANYIKDVVNALARLTYGQVLAPNLRK